ncbi:hypothetical protein HMPREF1990_02119 [Porphyromonas gingivalis W4087]|uniref:Uncharacterized protein n=1 Tax=Porphyromonas gingivalis F0570 TaxID=1227271 RepID=A0A0E2LQS5_PORGN|nr:hypothetical protein HMPREF1555_01085 [Porphyromonas gingivalis F0570]ERJ85685.1 hypothetical protein HMPREF1990_02119 [Porphyromonas gingivalis W4087]
MIFEQIIIFVVSLFSQGIAFRFSNVVATHSSETSSFIRNRVNCFRL